MDKLIRCTPPILIVLSIGFFAGCKKTPQATADSEIAGALAKVPGAADVKSAIDKKDYEGAMAALLKAKAAVATEDQQTHFMALNHWMKNKLIDAAPADPKAGEVLATMRAMSVGR